MTSLSSRCRTAEMEIMRQLVSDVMDSAVDFKRPAESGYQGREKLGRDEMSNFPVVILDVSSRDPEWGKGGLILVT